MQLSRFLFFLWSLQVPYNLIMLFFVLETLGSGSKHRHHPNSLLFENLKLDDDNELYNDFFRLYFLNKHFIRYNFLKGLNSPQITK